MREQDAGGEQLRERAEHAPNRPTESRSRLMNLARLGRRAGHPRRGASGAIHRSLQVLPPWFLRSRGLIPIAASSPAEQNTNSAMKANAITYSMAISQCRFRKGQAEGRSARATKRSECGGPGEVGREFSWRGAARANARTRRCKRDRP